MKVIPLRSAEIVDRRDPVFWRHSRDMAKLIATLTANGCAVYEIDADEKRGHGGVMRKEIVTQSAARQISADFPEPGYYAVKLIKDGPLIPLRIWLEREFDEAGDQMADDVIKCIVDGREADWRRHWPYCAAKPITAQQYERMRLGMVHNPLKAFDPSSTRVTFGAKR